MATELPLPKHADLPEVVLFHRQHPADPVLVMQVPTNEDRSESATYLIRLDRGGHKGWFDRLIGSRDLLERLSFEMHVAYCPASGFLREMKDLDEPSYAQLAVAYGRHTKNAESSTFQNVVERRRQLERLTPLPISQLRRTLSAPRSPGSRFGGGLIR